MTKYKKLLWPALAVVGLSVLSAAVVGLSVLSAPAAAGGPDCPAFTTEMVDAAAMAFGLSSDAMVSSVINDPSTPSIGCHLSSVPVGSFVLAVNTQFFTHEASVVGLNGQEEGHPVPFDAFLFSFAEGLTLSQEHACRTVVLNSFVWKNYCAPALP